MDESAETLGELIDRWLRTRTGVRDVTLQGYRDVLVGARGRLGARPVRSLTHDDVAALKRWLAEEGGRRGRGLSPRSVAATLCALALVLDLAVAEGTVAGNVARGVPRPRSTPRERAVWTLEDAAAFRSHARGDELGAAWLLLLAGVRRGEVLGLRWSDVDLAKGTVRISRVRIAVTPRTASVHPQRHPSAERVLLVGRIPGLLPAFRTLHAEQAAQRLLLGEEYADPGYVVTNRRGEPVRPEWFSDRFRSLCEQAGVPAVPLQEARRLAPDLLRSAAIPEATIAVWLGLDGEDPSRETAIRHGGAS